jgi:hypothetical protein
MASTFMTTTKNGTLGCELKKYCCHLLTIATHHQTQFGFIAIVQERISLCVWPLVENQWRVIHYKPVSAITTQI